MPAVESELLRLAQRRFPDRLAALKKALANGTLKILDESFVTSVGYRSASALIDQIDTLGFSMRNELTEGRRTPTPLQTS
jgi:hypothetical protein